MRTPAFAALSLVLVSAILAADPTPAEIDQAIRQLGDKRFSAREQASKKLWDYGVVGEQALRRAAKSSDPEVVRRARLILDKFDVGIYPDTSPTVIAQIDAFRGAGGSDRFQQQQEAINELVKLGKPGYLALVKLRSKLPADEAPPLSEGIHRALGAIMTEQDSAANELLLEATIDAGDEVHIAHYAASLIDRGRLSEAITRWETRAKDEPKRAAEVLAILHRAAGDLAAARRNALIADRAELVDTILWEQGDWKVLSQRPTLGRLINRELDGDSGLGLKALYLRLAGDEAEMNKAIADLRRVGTSEVGSEAPIWGLLLNEQIGEGIDQLKKIPRLRPIAMDLLAAQLRYLEAIQLADQPIEGDEATRKLLAIKKANLLHTLGEFDQAGQEFAKVAGSLQSPDDGKAALELIRCLERIGLRDLSRDTVAGYLNRMSLVVIEPEHDVTNELMETLFPQSGKEAGTWYRFLRTKFSKEPERATLRRVTELLIPAQPNPAVVAELAPMILENGEAPKAKTANALALVAAYDAHRQKEEALSLLATTAKKSDDFLHWIRWGDMLSAQGQHLEAAEAYAGAWQRDPYRTASPNLATLSGSAEAALCLAPFLRGKAIERAGRKEEAQGLFVQARRNPGGDSQLHARLAAELRKRDFEDLGREERQLAVKLGLYRAWPTGNLLPALARDALAKRDYAKAADCFERVLLGILANGYVFSSGGSYTSVPATIHAYRARAALMTGKIDEALQHATAGLNLAPGHQDVATLLVPELEGRGRKADADAIYAKALEPFQTLVEKYPKSAFAHNGAAWVGACCRRDLDGALSHAKKAVELAPKNSGYRDTLAEVHFQRGETAQAITLMQQCVIEEPKRSYYQRQLKRFQTGDRSVPPSEEEDD